MYLSRSTRGPDVFAVIGLRTDIRGRLQDKIMFGSDYPSLPLSRLLREWDELGFSEEVMHKVFHANAERVLGLKQA